MVGAQPGIAIFRAASTAPTAKGGEFGTASAMARRRGTPLELAPELPPLSDLGILGTAESWRRGRSRWGIAQAIGGRTPLPGESP